VGCLIRRLGIPTLEDRLKNLGRNCSIILRPLLIPRSSNLVDFSLLVNSTSLQISPSVYFSPCKTLDPFPSLIDIRFGNNYLYILVTIYIYLQMILGGILGPSSQTVGSLLKTLGWQSWRESLYSWLPCTNALVSTQFSIESIIFLFFTKQATLIRRSAALSSPPPQ